MKTLKGFSFKSFPRLSQFAGGAEGELWWLPVSHLPEYWCSYWWFVTINLKGPTWCIIDFTLWVGCCSCCPGTTSKYLNVNKAKQLCVLHLHGLHHPHSACAGICSATTPFVLLGDVLDCLPLDQCDKIFSFVEENVSTWKSVNNSQAAGKTQWKYFSSTKIPNSTLLSERSYRTLFIRLGRITYCGCAMVSAVFCTCMY